MSEKSFVALTKCFFCGEDDRIVLHRRLGDVSKIHGKVIDHEPCQKCADHMKVGVICLSVREDAEGDNTYRTGGFWVIKDAAIRKMVNPPELADDIIRKRMTYIPDSACKALKLPGSESL
jgi:hypothetical protein